jgi:hypothetical protein
MTELDDLIAARPPRDTITPVYLPPGDATVGAVDAFYDETDILTALAVGDGQVIPATRYGITGTPQASDAANLQEAIDDADATYSDGSQPIVKLPRGIVGLTDLVDRKRVLLDGAGSLKGTTFRWDGAADGTMWDGVNNSLGGFRGINFVGGDNEPAHFLDLTAALVDAMFVMEDVSFFECSDSPILMSDWTNLHWRMIRWDNCGGYAIDAQPTLGTAMFASSFHLSDFTYDHSRTSTPGSGFMRIDNSIRDGINLGPISLAHARVEVNEAWAAGHRCLLDIKHDATPNTSGIIPVSFDHIAFSTHDMVDATWVYRNTADTTRSENLEWKWCLSSGPASLINGVWSTKQPIPTSVPTKVFSISSMGEQFMIGTDDNNVLSVEAFSAGLGYTGRFLNRSSRGGMQAGRGASGAAPLELINTGGTVTIGFYEGTASPEGSQAAPKGSFFSDRTNGKLYFKSGGGTGNTGWSEVAFV